MKINLNLESYALMLYCSDVIPTKYPPLSSEEWLEVERLLKSSSMKSVSRLFGMNYEALTQIVGLETYLADKIMDRNQLTFDLFHTLHNLENEGVNVTTRYEEDYPEALKSLKKRMPPILYYVGSLDLIKNNNISIAGPQELNKHLRTATKNIVKKLLDENRTLIAGDIKGTDQESLKTMLVQEGKVVLFLADHMFDKIKKYSKYINKGQLTIISAVDPYAYFNVTNFLERNTYICGISQAQFITESTINEGAVWFTSTQNLHYNWTKLIALQSDDFFSGNLRLLEMGAIPVSSDDLSSLLTINEIIEKNEINRTDLPEIDQMSIYEFIKD